MKRRHILSNVIMGGIASASLLVIPLTSCSKGDGDGDNKHNSVNISWENNKNTIDRANGVIAIKATAIIKATDSVNPTITSWNYGSLPTYLLCTKTGNSIIFKDVDANANHAAQSFELFAIYKGTKSNILKFDVKQYTALDYDYEIILTSNAGDTLTQTTKSITITATLSSRKSVPVPVSYYVTWSLPSNIPGFITRPVTTTNTNSLEFKLVDDEETIANEYVIQASYNSNVENGAGIESFTLKTEDWEHWAQDWLPRRDLNIDGNGVLKGFDSGANLSGYDTLHIPKDVKSISANAFVDNPSSTNPTTKIPSDMVNIDFSAAISLESIGEGAFRYATFTNALQLPSGIRNIGKDAFYCCETINLIDLSRCDQLLSISAGAFSSCSGITNILFNDNLETLQSPNTAGAGVFEMGITGNPNWTSPTLKLPRKLKTIGGSCFTNLNAGSSTKITIDWNGVYQLETISRGAFSSIWFVDDTELQIPEGVKTIGGGIFMYSRGIKKIEIPSSVITLGPNALGDITRSGGTTYMLEEVKIKRTTAAYTYNDTLINTGGTNFDNWLRCSLIDKRHGVDCDANAKLYVPSNLYSTYVAAYPTNMTNAITSYNP